MKDNKTILTWKHLAITFLILLILTYASLIYARIGLSKFGEWVCQRECPKGHDSFFAGFDFNIDGSSMSYRCGNCVYSFDEEVDYVKV